MSQVSEKSLLTKNQWYDKVADKEYILLFYNPIQIYSVGIVCQESGK